MADQYPNEPCDPGRVGAGGTTEPSSFPISVRETQDYEARLNPLPQNETYSAMPPVSLRHILRLRWTILGVCVLIAVPSVAGIWATKKPQYRARATIEIPPRNPRIVYKTEETGLIPLYKYHLNSQVGIIRSREVLERVLQQSPVQQTQWYRAWAPSREPGMNETIVGGLGDALAVASRKQTFMIDVEFTASHPHDTATIVNAVVDEYLAFGQERAEKSNDLVYRRLLTEQQELARRIEARRSVVETLRSELGTNRPDKLVAQMRLRLDAAEAQLQKLRRDHTVVTWQKGELDRLLRESEEQASQPSADGPGPRYEDDMDWRKAHSRLRHAQGALDIAGLQFGDKHPTVLQLQKKLEHAELRLGDQEARLDGAWKIRPDAVGGRIGGLTIATELANLMRDISRLEKQEQVLEKDVAAQRVEFGQSFEKARLLAEQVKELGYQTDKYDVVRRRADEKETQRGVFGAIRLISPALAPSEPFKDRRFFLSVAAGGFSLAVGVGLAFLRVILCQRILDAADLPPMLREPFLGHLPLDSTVVRGQSEEGTHQEHYRVIRTSLLTRLANKRGAAVLVTSGSWRAGRTTLSVKLAESIARGGKRVLLVEADLRSPSIATRLGVDPNPGLTSILKGHAGDSEAIRSTDRPRLAVLPAGPLDETNDPERLGDGTFETCLDRWRKAFDVVLIDSPPVLPVADSHILARQVDGIVFVVREDHCRRSDIMQALTYLNNAGGRLLGSVIMGKRRNGLC